MFLILVTSLYCDNLLPYTFHFVLAHIVFLVLALITAHYLAGSERVEISKTKGIHFKRFVGKDEILPLSELESAILVPYFQPVFVTKSFRTRLGLMYKVQLKWRNPERKSLTIFYWGGSQKAIDICYDKWKTVGEYLGLPLEDLSIEVST
jgi:hypothetical protein